MSWYFAYGSNLSKSQMKERIGNWKTSEKALLNGWKLVFNVPSSTWGGGAANIVKTDNPNDVVYGAIYEITRNQIEILTKRYEKVSPKTLDVESDEKVIEKSEKQPINEAVSKGVLPLIRAEK